MPDPSHSVYENFIQIYNLKPPYYTQYVLISKGPISKTSQISGFFKQWLVKFSKLSNNLFCSGFLSNPLVIFFNLSRNKLLLLHSNLLTSVSCLDMLKLLCHSLDSACTVSTWKKNPKFYVCLFTFYDKFLITGFFNQNIFQIINPWL